jgi:hypothetical protein
VPVEELDDPGRLAEPADPLVDPVAVERVDDPDASGRGDRMRGALAQLLLNRRPPDAPLELVDEPNLHRLNPQVASRGSDPLEGGRGFAACLQFVERTSKSTELNPQVASRGSDPG